MISKSELDSNRFGIPVAKLRIGDPAQAAALEAEISSQAIQLTIARVDSSMLPAVHILENAGFQIMDTLVFYRATLSSLANRSDIPGGYLRGVARYADQAAVHAAALIAFANYSGHYHADPRLDRAACDALYADWAARSCVDKSVATAMHLLLDEITGEIAGFASVKQTAAAVVDGPLFGVTPQHRSRGLFRTLLGTAMGWAKAQGAESFTYSTQLTNTAVQKVLVDFGFRLEKSEYTLHRWAS
jgi:GNAT superfamily N-acetyltransferase